MSVSTVLSKIVALSFWSEFTLWYFLLCSKKLCLSKLEIMYGVLQPSCLTLNNLILVGKYFLYICSLNPRRYHFGDFIALVWEKIEIEKHNATSSDKLNIVRKKWSCLLSNNGSVNSKPAHLLPRAFVFVFVFFFSIMLQMPHDGASGRVQMPDPWDKVSK